ncbi:tRNA (adenosine(37)-N6)-dimethylallyltransferase MiaA [Sunxiuqinia sp. A32]|uniref:tRNA (adenosine(37)-N6)-dimethylallyltransferase MiaA n=1 Tax=Sunxiuqinia sp. A32 TaxID=3461496 RepID=UPI004045E2D6
MEKTLVVVLGPTGVGKSDLSIRIAKEFSTEIISSDSRQIYRELSIGTAVPPQKDIEAVNHHLIHSHSITEYYSASQFEKEALAIIETLHKYKPLALMTGGSMMYIDALCNGIDELPTVDAKLRDELANEFKEFGIEHLRLQLKKLDPVYYEQVDLKNPKRLLHALEICMMTGKPYSLLRTKTIKQRPFRIIKIGLNRDREELYNRINLRVDQMIADGLEQEARSVYENRHLNSLNTVGYRELFSYFDGEISLEKAIELIKRNSRHYARKQLTWFRKDQAINWFHPDQEDEIVQWLKNELHE